MQRFGLVLRDRRVQRTYVALFAIALALIGAVHPIHNWDGIAYTAAAKGYGIQNPNDLHAFAYAEARQFMPDQAFADLTTSTVAAYRQQLYDAPTRFADQLCFYEARPMYVGTAWALSQLTGNTLVVLHVLSGLCAGAGLWLLFALGQRFLPAAAVYAVPLVASVFGLLHVSRLATPDAMGFAAIAASVWLFVRNRAWLWWVLPLAGLVREDLVLWSGPLYAYGLLWGRNRRWAVVASAIAAALLPAIFQHGTGHPGWSTTFHMTVVENAPYDAAVPAQLSFAEYATAVKAGLVTASRDKVLLLFLALVVAAGVTVFQTWPRTEVSRRWAYLVGASLAYVLVHFALIPVTWERFFVAPYLVTCVALVALIASRHPEPALPASGFASRV